jgi:hypothetical protein
MLAQPATTGAVQALPGATLYDGFLFLYIKQNTSDDNLFLVFPLQLHLHVHNSLLVVFPSHSLNNFRIA